MATRRATGNVTTSSSAKTAEKEDTHSESDQRVLEAIRQSSTTTRPSKIVGTATSSASTSNTSLSATKAEEKENNSESDPRLLEASSTLIAWESEDQGQNQHAGGGNGYMQMQVVESARKATHVAPEVGNFASENPLLSSSSSTMMMETTSSTSASTSHNDLPSKSRTTVTTILSASISAFDIQNFESDSDQSPQAGFVTAGSAPPVQFLSNESDSSTQGGRVAQGSLGMTLAVFDRPASSEIYNTSTRYRPLIVDRIMAFADVRSRRNLREAVSILQEPNEGHSDTGEEESGEEPSPDASCEAHEENSEKGETSSSDDDCPRSDTSNRRQRAPQDRQDEKDSGSGGSHDSNPGDGNGNEDKESPDQSDIVTRSAQEANNKSKDTLSTLETDNNIEDIHADHWGLNLFG